MPNRFTEKLDALVPEGWIEYIYWRDLDKILPEKLVDELVDELDSLRPVFESLEHFNPVKALALCFIAEMSDEDLREVFGI